ncbi:MAG: hypothetical protein ACPGUD_13680 [Parashewanella sp.]
MAAAYSPSSYIESLSKFLDQISLALVSLQRLFNQYQVTRPELISNRISQWLLPALEAISEKQNIQQCVTSLTSDVFNQCESTCVCLQPYLPKNYSFGKQDVKTRSDEKLTLFFAQESNKPLFIFNSFRIPSESSSSMVNDEYHSKKEHERKAIHTSASIATQVAIQHSSYNPALPNLCSPHQRVSSGLKPQEKIATEISEQREKINDLLSDCKCTVEMRAKLIELSSRLDMIAHQKAINATGTQSDTVKKVAIKSTQFHLPN